ncbi:GNAT family N-acetyltransferase [Dyadobacter chenwenxiniae]|uniref:GNAT family N-acetyltransferase n=1 Tax=Dyadobacter chenwenxiniae TaxID=2906456 RepID=A0A9X1TG46_9BACT|nr:GNAT family N-acetyltransferase [Dyadobacter chenwenxiniae]MCF0049815.1 GNAT family N-acetyltransferase [Dyadobacter chenwenxiniae]MCF0049893.1 GNAT family N-acetyltransferase [Dyadobacter chenwenxiniae]MCF0065066.1 GNAT family N-acetyltransferase [Dyadobacter chenwenxiniae]UON83181.1 GNAT family N-acetyltransferase [Dyadobacter chenwenxiniae]
MDLKLNWNFKTFEALSKQELYEILRIRNEVFVVEQRCCYPDLDGKDQKSHHLCGFRDDNLLAYARILPPGVSYEFASIGRIVVSGQGRGMGYGIELLNESIKKVEELYGKTIIRIGAQLYLKRFYGSFGFVQSSGIYLEDDIEHIEMTRQITEY